jgi:hypothetical protein
VITPTERSAFRKKATEHAETAERILASVVHPNPLGKESTVNAANVALAYAQTSLAFSALAEESW